MTELSTLLTLLLIGLDTGTDCLLTLVVGQLQTQKFPHLHISVNDFSA